MKLTALMLAALQRAKAEDGLRRVHDTEHGRPPWPAPAATLAALVRHGLLDRCSRISRKGARVDEWTLTDQGRTALDPPPPQAREPRDLYLAARPGRLRYKTLPPAAGKKAGRVTVDDSGPANADYTNDPGRQLPGAGIVLPDPDPSWTDHARERHADAQDRRRAARRARRAA